MSTQPATAQADVCNQQRIVPLRTVPPLRRWRPPASHPQTRKTKPAPSSRVGIVVRAFMALGCGRWVVGQEMYRHHFIHL